MFKARKLLKVSLNDDTEPDATFALDTGDMINVAFSTEWMKEQNTLACKIVAWPVDKNGNPITDANGAPITRTFIHNADAPSVQRYGAGGIAAILLNAVMGEKQAKNTPIWFSEEIMQQLNIRDAIMFVKATKRKTTLKKTMPKIPPFTTPYADKPTVTPWLRNPEDPKITVVESLPPDPGKPNDTWGNTPAAPPGPPISE